MRVIGIIPARWASTRFPGKVLAKIKGKPMIEHVWTRCRLSRRLNEVLIACDDRRILQAAEAFGAQAVMTDTGHNSGTDRIAEAAAKLKADIIINIQGDEPLVHPGTIDDLAAALINDPSVVMATVIKAITLPEELVNPNVVKVVVDQQQNALYFSRSVIPFDRDQKGFRNVPYFKHLGIYGYRKDFLTRFSRMPKSRLEEAERLEQLRALEAGVKIRTVLTDVETAGVDTPEDLARVEKLLR
ncbi:MAG: 3-deoxy-manno-octulosonate cytidylyltransferase [Candidatus Omnitrophica bacterium]|nr:3-deoxy-manno-octulosonate cytidylyltransferase [Candidatus Omnitrophota bacterium]